MSDLPPPEKVLIIKPSALGDVVTAVPVLRGLRRTFPAARVDWLVGSAHAELIAHDSALDEVVLFERRRLGRAWRSPSATAELARLLKRLRRARYDWVLDLQGLLRSGMLTRATAAPVRAGFADAREGAWLFYTHRVLPAEPHTVDRNLAVARELGVDARGEDLRLEVAAEAREAVEALLAGAGLSGRRFLLVVPPTRWATKRYPVARWREVVQHLTADCPVALAGGPGDREACGEIADGLAGACNLAGRTSVSELVALTACAAGVVCCDSAAKFIAAAVGTPPLVLTGPTQPERTGPYRLGRALWAEVPCRGCLRKRCPHVTCMQAISPAAVAAAARELFPA